MLRLAAGQDAALNDLMDRHGARVFHFMLRSLQNPEDAADLAQETFVRVYQNRGRFDRDQKFTTWLYAIAANLVRDRFRWRSRHPQVSLTAENSESGSVLQDTLVDPAAAPDQQAQTREQVAAIEQAVAALPLELREALILSVFEGLSHLEIGEVLGCSAKGVETRIYRARNRLRDQLGAFRT